MKLPSPGFSLAIPAKCNHNATHMNEEEFRKLLLEKLDGIDGRLYRIERRLDGTEEKLNKLTEDLSQLRSDTKSRFTDVSAAVQIVYDGIREILDQQEIEAKERIHMDIVLKRHERWINGLANHAKLKLSQS